MGFQRWHPNTPLFFFIVFLSGVFFSPPVSLVPETHGFDVCVQRSVEIVWHRHTQDTRDGVHTVGWCDALALKTHNNNNDNNNGRRGGERETHRQRDPPVWLAMWLGCFFFFVIIFLYRIPFSPLTLLGLTALCRFSIHLSLSAAERHAKHLVPDAVVTWGYSQW